MEDHSQDNGVRFTANEMAQLLGVSERAIQQWADEGMPYVRIKGKVNRYPWRECHEWWLANKYTGPHAGSAERMPSKIASEAELLHYKAGREKMRLERDKQQLLPIEEIDAAWQQAANTVKDAVLAISKTIKLTHPSLTDEDVAAIDKACKDTLRAIAKCPTQQQNA